MITSTLHKAISPIRYGLGLYERDWLRHARHQSLTAVLCYHRVVSHAADNAGLFNVEKGVTAEDFARQMRFMLKHFSPIKPSEVGLKGGENALQFAVTFDDGYLDNFTVAAPILQSLGISASFYVVSKHLQTGDAFWWEVLGQILRATRVRQLNVFEILPSYVQQGFCPGLLPLGDAVKNEKAHAQLSRGLLNGQVSDLPESLGRIAQALGIPLSATHRQLPLMTVNHLRQLVSQGFEIGGHTANHVNLGGVSPDTLEREITQSIAQIEQLTDSKVLTFAFPYGGASHQSDASIEKIKNAGCQCAFTTEKRLVTSNEDVFRLPRIQLNHPWQFACAKNLHDALRRSRRYATQYGLNKGAA